jgi:putative RNA 2'-phosphotransferase
MGNDLVAISKFLSLVLRHRPETIGLSVGSDGWARIDQLLGAAKHHGQDISPGMLEEVVFTNDKQRFAFSPDGRSIRANQGHSIPVDLQLQKSTPPEVLFHGTATRFLSAIRSEGLCRMRRHHVHLSATVDVARRVGARHGEAVVLTIASGRMFSEGAAFYLAANGVWLTDTVATPYILDMP